MQQVSLNLPENLLNRLEEKQQATGNDRSALIRNAIAKEYGEA